MFDKYEIQGAYHWAECDRTSRAFNPPLLARYEVVLRVLDGACVLDVGAGDGYFTARLAKRASWVYALEYEPAGVEIARRMLAKRANVVVVNGSAYTIPFGDGLFDAAVMADVIEHLAEPDRAIGEVSRVLRPGGRLYLTTPQWRPDRVWDHRHVKEYRPDEMKAMLELHFASVEMRYFWPLFWSNLYRTRLGWRGLKLAGRLGFNPFLRQGANPAGFGQMLAICRKGAT